MEEKKPYKNRRRRTCFVPKCNSSTIDTPNKIFVAVPLEPDKRKKWMALARRDMEESPIGPRTHVDCCEDHFNAKEDFINYGYCKFVIESGSVPKIRVKPGVLPHIFDCQTDRNVTKRPARCSVVTKLERKEIIKDLLQQNPSNISVKQEQLESPVTEQKQIQSGFQLNRVKTLTPIRSKSALLIPRPTTTWVMQPISTITEIKPPFASFASQSPIASSFEHPSHFTNLDIAQNKTALSTTEEQEHWNQQSQIIGNENKCEIKMEIKQEELDISCDCTENDLRKCAGMYENVMLCSIPPDELMEHSNEEPLQDPLLIESPEGSDVANTEAANSIIIRLLQTPPQNKKLKHDEALYCKHCGKSFTIASELEVHILSHTKKLYKCPTCYKEFTDIIYFQRHKYTHTRNQPYACSICEYKCTERGNLQTHLRTHTGEKPFICPICRKGFRNGSHFKKHKRIHSRQKPYACDMCNYRCRVAGYLKIHMRIHTKCPTCHKEIGGVEHLQKHECEENLYVCNVCNYRFTERNDLETHICTHKRDSPTATVCKGVLKRDS